MCPQPSTAAASPRHLRMRDVGLQCTPLRCCWPGRASSSQNSQEEEAKRMSYAHQAPSLLPSPLPLLARSPPPTAIWLLSTPCGLPPTLSPLARMSGGCLWELDLESSAKLPFLLTPECFSRNHSPAMFLKDACRCVAFRARMGAVKFLCLHNSGSRSARVINEHWQAVGDDVNMLSLCHIQFLFPLPTKRKAYC